MERLTKDEIRELPLFQGLSLANIKIITNKKEAKVAIAELKRYKSLGFDTESKPCFRKGEISSGPHLIQLSTSQRAFLFPSKFPEVIKNLGEILSNPDIRKVGFGLDGDKKILQSKFGIDLVNIQDLSLELKKLSGDKDAVGLRAGVAMVLQKRLSKNAQRSNWAAFPLRERQLKYAANDAFASICIEQKLLASV